MTARVHTQSSTHGQKVTSFYKNLYHSLESASHQEDPHWDLLYCLALATEHHLDLLPIRWRPDFDDTPDHILEGGTAKIDKLKVDVKTSLMFKRVRVLDAFKQIDDERTYEALCQEIAILTHQPIREHPNIVRLEGLCWDIEESTNTVYPALVFERAFHGDAFRFFNLAENCSLPIEIRWKLCIDIARGIAILHASREYFGSVTFYQG